MRQGAADVTIRAKNSYRVTAWASGHALRAEETVPVETVQRVATAQSRVQGEILFSILPCNMAASRVAENGVNRFLGDT